MVFFRVTDIEILFLVLIQRRMIDFPQVLSSFCKLFSQLFLKLHVFTVVKMKIIFLGLFYFDIYLILANQTENTH